MNYPSKFVFELYDHDSVHMIVDVHIISKYFYVMSHNYPGLY